MTDLADRLRDSYPPLAEAEVLARLRDPSPGGSYFLLPDGALVHPGTDHCSALEAALGRKICCASDLLCLGRIVRVNIGSGKPWLSADVYSTPTSAQRRWLRDFGIAAERSGAGVTVELKGAATVRALIAEGGL